MDIQSKIILIFGATASGKSKFAIQLAKRINGEIINADSMQVYKELKILTDRPKNKETSPSAPAFAAQCIGKTSASGKIKFITPNMDFFISPA